MTTSTDAAPPAPSPTRWIADAAALDELIGALRDEPRYALDTEFHRERTYYPKVALVQVAWPGGVAVVDPLAVDVRPFAKVLDGPGVAVLHAAQQDLDVLTRACGTIPARLVDTQLAAGFLGYASPSLVNLLAAELGVRLPKADRLTDWLRRPLTTEQVVYAAADVAYLLALHDRISAQLQGLGRLSWAAAECEELRIRPAGPAPPEEAWLKLKDARSLRGKGRGVAAAVASWRERRAAELDQPVRFVLSDLAILGIAQRPPGTLDELRAVRGLDDRHARGTTGRDLLAAIAAGTTTTVETPAPNGDDLERHLRPAVTLVSAWVSQLARDQRIDTSLLATRADVIDLLRGAPDARLTTGWRAEMLGDDIQRLVAGEAALAFDDAGGGQLRLIAVPRPGPEGR